MDNNHRDDGGWCRFYLRRRKKILKEFQQDGIQKIDRIVFCRLSEPQRSVYLRLLRSPDFQTLLVGCKPCDCGSDIKALFFCDQGNYPHPGAVIFNAFHHEEVRLDNRFLWTLLHLFCNDRRAIEKSTTRHSPLVGLQHFLTLTWVEIGWIVTLIINGGIPWRIKINHATGWGDVQTFAPCPCRN